MSFTGERRRARRSVGRRRRLLAIGVTTVAVVLIGAALAVFAWTQVSRGEEPVRTAASPSRTPTPTPTPTPLTPAEALLTTTSDPSACAVVFAGEAITLDPMLQTKGTLYAGLPIPRLEGRVFAGWYASAADAASPTIAARINGSELVECAQRQRTLYGAWTTPEANAAEGATIPILMYHQFTPKPEGESNSLRLNYAYVGDFDAHMAYIADSQFYLPTWDELSAFIDGELFLPQHSVIVTDDDADITWLELAAPIVEARKILTTSFVITKWRAEGAPNPYVLQRSHTHDMHEAGANGKGRMVNWTAAEIAADLEQSALILGAKEVIAYPFGHHDDVSKQGVAQAGFELARTIEPGYVRIGTDKLALPTIRIDFGMNVDTLPELIG